MGGSNHSCAVISPQKLFPQRRYQFRRWSGVGAGGQPVVGCVGQEWQIDDNVCRGVPPWACASHRGPVIVQEKRRRPPLVQKGRRFLFPQKGRRFLFPPGASSGFQYRTAGWRLRSDFITVRAVWPSSRQCDGRGDLGNSAPRGRAHCGRSTHPAEHQPKTLLSYALPSAPTAKQGESDQCSREAAAPHPAQEPPTPLALLPLTESASVHRVPLCEQTCRTCGARQSECLGG